MGGGGKLALRLAGADGDELLALVEANLSRMDVEAAAQAIRNPFVSREVIELLAGHKGLLANRGLRSQLAAHRQTPEPLAMRLVSTLFWPDLVALGVETRVRPTVRRAADRALAGRLAAMSIGERMAVARRASPAIIAQLLRDPERRVVGAALDNPRTTEGSIVPLLASDRAHPGVLETIISHRRWGNRYTLRAQFCRNPRAPTARVLREMAMLRKVDLRSLTTDPRLAPAVRRRADLLLGRPS